MSVLPRHLAPWAQHLAFFPKEIAIALGAVISRLRPLIGSGEEGPTAEGEPDGYAGIARRGPYNLLLAAEWLLLDEVPDEFLRRSVFGEHSFLRRAHSQPGAAKRCVALFDAGADQLGSPRIAHLALLILLARRAEEQGATFEWGILQVSTAGLHAGATNATVLELLKGRCVRSVSSEDIERWLAVCPEKCELWLIGAANLASGAPTLDSFMVTVSDVLEPGTPRRIHVRVAPPRLGRMREAVLEVPSNRIAVQLLTEPFSPFAGTAAGAIKVDVRSNLVFATDGRRLHVRGAGSTLVTFQVPNSPAATPGPPVALAAPEGHTILAVGRSAMRKRILVLTQHGHEAFIHVISKRGCSIIQSERFQGVDGFRLQLAGSRDLLQPLGILEGERVFLVNIGSDIIELSEGKMAPRIAAAALASRALRHGFAWASLRGDIPQITWARMTRTGQLELTPSTTPARLPCMYNERSFHLGGGLSNLFAYGTSPSSWVISHDERASSVAIADGFSIVGVVVRGSSPSGSCLVALDETRTRLELVAPGYSEKVLTTVSGITGIGVSGTSNDIAFMTEAGEVGVYSCPLNAVIMRSTAGGGQ